MSEQLRIVISGGGTGGHIFPAVSIANAIKVLKPEAEILFVGALGRMEMERVPQAGYNIIGLPVRGLVRPLYSLRNISVVRDYLRSQRMAKKTLKDFQPVVAVGVGGYASAATLKAAHKLGIPTLIQEQNSYAGVTNKMLASTADKICVAYDGMERFFPAAKLIKTGNPVRQAIATLSVTPTTKEAALSALGLQKGKRTIVFTGGSLGARTINESVLTHLDDIRKAEDVQILLQTGAYYRQSIVKRLQMAGKPNNLIVTDFITDMPAVYRAADLIVSRAGASSISEFCIVGKAVILVPSPNVAEDHQTKNALTLVNRDAALYIRDDEAVERLLATAIEAVRDKARLSTLETNIKKLALPNSAEIIAREVLSLAKATTI